MDVKQLDKDRGNYLMDRAGRFAALEQKMSSRIAFFGRAVKNVISIKLEFSFRAAFIGAYITPDKQKLWICIVPFLPIYIKLKCSPSS